MHLISVVLAGFVGGHVHELLIGTTCSPAATSLPITCVFSPASATCSAAIVMFQFGDEFWLKLLSFLLPRLSVVIGFISLRQFEL